MAFWQLTVPSSPDTSEGLTNFLWELGALGVVEEEEVAAPPRLRAFFAGNASSATLLRSTEAYVADLEALGFRTGGGAVEIAPLVEEAWASAWQQSFPPRAVGKRLWITAPWVTHRLGARSTSASARASSLSPPSGWVSAQYWGWTSIPTPSPRRA